MKIPYTSVRRDLTSDEKRTFVAVYYPLLGTTRETEDSVQLSYAWCHILRDRNSPHWHVFKCRKQQLLSHVIGDGYGEAMIRTTGLGLSHGEPAFTYEANAATRSGVRIWLRLNLLRNRSRMTAHTPMLALRLWPSG